MPQNQLEKAKMVEINRLVNAIAPNVTTLLKFLRSSDIHEFEIIVDNGADKMVWSDGKVTYQSPTQTQLADELMRILDEAYPPNNGFSFMGLIWNPNRAIAEKMASVIAEFRRKDKQQLESQMIAITQAFKAGH